MPLYSYKCINPSCTSYNAIVEKIQGVNTRELLICEQCQVPLQRTFPKSLHVVGVGKEKDGKDLGKVTKEKNESLKKKWAGYSYEEQNIRKKVTKMAEEKTGRKMA